jgi:hypothetical protein
MKMIEIIEEQVLQKIKDKLSDVGKKIGDLKNKAQDIVKPEINPVIQKHMEFVEKWKKTNDDLNSNKIFVEGNDGGHTGNSLINRLKLQAVSIYTKRELNKNPNQTTIIKRYTSANPLDWSCYVKPDEKGQMVTYCAYVFEIIG